MSDTCVHHGIDRADNCPICLIITANEEITALKGKNEKFYRWFKSMSREQVDEMLEKVK